MASHADILDRPEPMRVPFWTSVVMHVLVVGALSAGAILDRTIQMGSPTGGGFGSVQVNPVASIPIPNRGGIENPVASDTQSQVPAPPAPKKEAKAAPKLKTPTAAITLPTDKANPKRTLESYRSQYHPPQVDDTSRVYSSSGARANTPAFQLPGGGGTTLGDKSPFGQEFGYYATMIQQLIGRQWNPNQRGGSRFVIVTFTIRRDGSVTNVTTKQSSGIQLLDRSAERAVQDAHLPALPAAFRQNQADVELRFELGN